MHQPLADSRCVPCQEAAAPLKPADISVFQQQLSPEWQVVDGHHLERKFTFKNFRQALDFVNTVGGLAETQGHHPDIYLSWGKVKISLWTHKINGLHENDFILAAKIDHLQTADTTKQ